jgi:TM2 domain-containing membrane protein YozV
MVPYAQQPLAPVPSYPQPAPYAQPYAPPAPTYPAYPQPVNVVIQNHIPAPAYAPVPYAMVPYAKRKDAGVATLLSFFLPGAGQLYNGQVGKGVAFILVSIFVNFPLMFIGIGFLTALATWIWAMIDAHSSAEKINRGEIVV